MNILQKLIFFLIVISFLPAFANNDSNPGPLVLNGYDAVAYQTEAAAKRGDSSYTANYQGWVYQFTSAENRDLFIENPSKYAPEYGGYCAYGMAFGAKVPVDGTAFQIVNGKLYVNKNQAVYQLWQQDIPGNIAKANAQWQRIQGS